MADFWKDLGNEVKDGVDWLSKKTEDLVQSGKETVDRIQLQSNLEKLYQQLGREFYTMYKNDNLKMEELKNICDQINEIQDKLKTE